MAKPIPSAFASAVQPVAAQTLIVTDDNGLLAGDVSIPTADGSIPGYRAAPAAGDSHPVILVVQEIFGVHEHIKDVCRRLAKLGYLAVAPELYFRQGDVSGLPTIDEIRKVVSAVPDEQVLSDLDETVIWAEHHGGDTSRLGITGFCWGGRVTWLYAAHQPKLKAGVAWYGKLDGETSKETPEFPLHITDRVRAPVLGLYGGQDASIPQDQVDKMNTSLQQAGSPSNIHVYPNAPHAFNADYRPSYRADAAQDGWQRMQAWFKQYGVAAGS
jgi:carboxymethylenebutenolidase